MDEIEKLLEQMEAEDPLSDDYAKMLKVLTVLYRNQEISDKINELLLAHKGNKDLEKMAQEKSYRRYVANVLENEKVLTKLKEWNYADSGNK